MSTATHSRRRNPERTLFRHQALLYTGDDEFLAAAGSFARDAVSAGEPVLVMVNAAKIDLLRSALGSEADSVYFADMARVGRNPARIIPAWHDFVAEHRNGGRRLRGIGEPIWPARRPAEVAECQQHEALLNLAFADTPAFWLLCPYDRVGLDPAVIDEACRSHPFVGSAVQWERADYQGDGIATAALDGPLPAPPCQAPELGFGAGQLGSLRRLVSRQAVNAGLSAARTADLVLAVNEVTTNSLRHGGGRGTLRIWRDGDALVCEIRDEGWIPYPLVGRQHPPTESDGARGLWIVNQLCDLVQLRSSPAGTVVRLHMSIRPSARDSGSDR